MFTSHMRAYAATQTCARVHAPALHNALPDVAHERQLVGNVVDRQQVARHRLPLHDGVEVRPRVVLAAGARGE